MTTKIEGCSLARSFHSLKTPRCRHTKLAKAQANGIAFVALRRASCTLPCMACVQRCQIAPTNPSAKVRLPARTDQRRRQAPTLHNQRSLLFFAFSAAWRENAPALSCHSLPATASRLCEIHWFRCVYIYPLETTRNRLSSWRMQNNHLWLISVAVLGIISPYEGGFLC